MIVDVEQGSEEWLRLRCGRVTASRIADLMARTKSGWGASRANYMGELLAERLTGVPAEQYVSEPMRWGTDKEPEARAAYEFMADQEVKPIGFAIHPSIDMAAASPDGRVGDDGLVEIKCPNLATHIETLRRRAVPSRYVGQMQWQMACAERQWCDFISFDPRLPPTMRLFVDRVHRDEKAIADIERHVTEFLAELDATLLTLNTLYAVAA